MVMMMVFISFYHRLLSFASFYWYNELILHIYMTMRIDLFAAMTVDGRIAQHEYHGNDWTSSEDNAFLRNAMEEYDLIVVGFRTFQVASKVFSKYPCLVLTKEEVEEGEEGSVSYFNYNKGDIQDRLKALEVERVAVLGGTFVYSDFLKRKLFDNLYLTIEPLIWGSGLPLCDHGQVIEQHLTFVEAKTLNKQGTVLLHYSA